MKIVFALVFCIIATSSFAQQKPTDIDKSPLDISYYPTNYPILKMNGKAADSPIARVIYSRPQKAGRVIFGGIVSYDQLWRLGANEATEIEFFRNVKINGKTVSKGRYTMYAICHEATWTIILNNEKDVWGLYYNTKKDVLRTDIPVVVTENIVENFTMYFDDMNGGAKLVMLWDNVRAELSISF